MNRRSLSSVADREHLLSCELLMSSPRLTLFFRLVLGAALAALLLMNVRRSAAVGVVYSVGTPVQHRVALAVGPEQSTLWSQIRLDAAAGTVAVVVPAPDGARLDWSSDAWLESLEVATAPRVLPPPGLNPTCDGSSDPAAVDVVGDTAHVDTLTPLEVAVLDDANQVVLWAEQHSLAVSPELSAALAALVGQRFVVARFSAPGGTALTPTLRVVSPQPLSELPLVLVQASSAEVLVQTWLFGPGRATIDGATVAQLATSSLTFAAANGTSNYPSLRQSALSAAGTDAVLIESASHDSLGTNLAIAEGNVAIDSVVTTFFQRAELYGDAGSSAAVCIAQAQATLEGSFPVATACPRTALGTVGSVGQCDETVQPGEIDPELLRCGDGVDDLALAISGLTPASTWLTRYTMQVPAGSGGAIRTVSFSTGDVVTPVWTAASLDLSGCNGSTGGGTATGGSSGSPSGPGGTTVTPTDYDVVPVPVYYVEKGCGSDEVGEVLFYIDIVFEEGDEPPEAYYAEESCRGDTTYTYEDDPDYWESRDYYGDDYYDDEDYEQGGCSGDTSETSDTSDDSESSSGSDCDGDTSDTSDDDDDDSSTSGDDDDDSSDSSSSSSTSCGDDDDDDGDSSCVISSRRGSRPKFSVLVIWAVGLLLPLRRLLRRRRCR